MTWLLTLFARWGLPEPVRRPLAIALGLIALLATLTVLKGCYDRAVEHRYEAKVAAQVTKATDAANDAANTNDAKRHTENARADEQLRSTIDAAAKDHPEAARSSAGPVTTGVLGKLRERQASPRPATH